MRPSRLAALLAPAVLCFPAASPASVGDESVGVNIHIGYPAFIDAAADLRVAWVRVDGNWNAMNPSSGSYDWSFMDTTVDRASAKGLKVFMTLGYTPGWVPHHGNSAECQSGSGPGKCAPNGSSEWTTFVDAAVRRYRAKGVTHFGLWNEANLDGFWDAGVDEYVSTIVKPGAQAVRSACADCKVLGPDLAHVGEADDALDSILSLAPTTFDIITHHSYNGFSELGTDFWDGDRFPEVLDEQRCVPPFWCGRRSLRQVLDENGWAGEVWITETGLSYKDGSGNSSCNPTTPNCPADNPLCDDEAKQARYVELVLGEQLSRPWYTNTFFYEIQDCRPDQPGCDIDGFGLMRATGGSPDTRSYPNDVCRKDAFWALKNFITAHPEIVGSSPPAQCANGADDDVDGMTDLDDPGCVDGTDGNESDHPPRKQVEAFRTGGITLDGDLADWGGTGWLGDSDTSWYGFNALSGAGDCSVRAAARWVPGYLYLAFDVTDDVQDNAHVPGESWMGDGVQTAFDVSEDSGIGYDDGDDHEINFALLASGPVTYRYHGPVGAQPAQVEIVRAGGHTRYETSFSNTALPGVTWAAGTQLGFSFIVNDADGSGREGWRELTPGIGVRKAPAFFAEVVLRDQLVAGTDAGVPLPGPDASTAAGADASAHPGADTGTAVVQADGSIPDGADAGQPAEGDAAVVAATDSGHDLPPGGSGACGCAAGSGAPALLLALASLGLLRRRR